MFYSVRHRAINLSLLERLRSVTIFQKNLAKLMSEQGLNQVELAERSGVNQSHVAKLLSGRRVPSLKTLEKLAAGLNVAVGALVDPTPPFDGHKLQAALRRMPQGALVQALIERGFPKKAILFAQKLARQNVSETTLRAIEQIMNLEGGKKKQ